MVLFPSSLSGTRLPVVTQELLNKLVRILAFVSSCLGLHSKFMGASFSLLLSSNGVWLGARAKTLFEGISRTTSIFFDIFFGKRRNR